MATRRANVRRLLAALESRAPAVAAEITERIERELVEIRAVDDPEFQSLVHESSIANIAAAMQILSEGGRLPRAAPADVGEAARAAANTGVSLATLLRAYRIAHAISWREWMKGTEELGLPDAERTELLEYGSNFLFEFVDHVATLVTEAYTRERDTFTRTLEQREIRLVRDLLEGVVNDASGLEYDLGLEHVGCVGGGDDAEPLIKALGAQLEARVLTVASGDDEVWGWIGTRSPPTEREWRLLRNAAPADGSDLAIGDTCSGLAGFRQTHAQAVEARRVGAQLGRRLVLYDDVALEALAVRDERQAAAFAERELGALGGDDERSRRLRETLRVYFASGQTAAAAAATLGVHDQTVSYRLRTIEEQLGRPVAARRAELEVALRIFDLRQETGA